MTQTASQFLRPYMLVLMSVDRFVARLIPRRSMTPRAALISAGAGLMAICFCNLPILRHFSTLQYQVADEVLITVCTMTTEYQSSVSRFVSLPSLQAAFAKFPRHNVAIVKINCITHYSSFISMNRVTPALTRSSSIAEGSRDAPCQLKLC